MKVFKIFLINFFLLFFFLWITELSINYKKDNLFKKTRLHYLNKDKFKKKKNIYLNFGGYKFLDKKKLIYPLSGYDNSITLLCLNKRNEPIYFKSDDYGFRNQNRDDKIDILLIGDSYVQGMCVDNENNLNAQLLKKKIKTISLGIGGNGPLLEYATFKEYQKNYEFKNVILFITLENDYYDLLNESKNKTLMRYLNDKNFTQRLTENKNKILKKELLDSYFGNTNRLFNDFFSVYHFNFKEISNLIKLFFKKKTLNNNFDYFEDSKLDELYYKILSQFKLLSNIKKANFYVVFNLVEPTFLYPTSKVEKEYNKLIFDKMNLIKNFLDRNKIIYYDHNEYAKLNYDLQNISEIYNYINGRWDHYTNKGYYEITDQMLKKFKLIN